MIHEYEPGNPFRSDLYPEPKFDDLSPGAGAARLPRPRRPRGTDRPAVRLLLGAVPGAGGELGRPAWAACSVLRTITEYPPPPCRTGPRHVPTASRPDRPRPLRPLRRGRPPKVKLAVLVVFDQMRGDYLAKWRPLFGPDGFSRLQTDGAWFADCHYPYATTTTGPGHASVLTGRRAGPARHRQQQLVRAGRQRRLLRRPPTATSSSPPPKPPEPAAKTAKRGEAAEGGNPERLLHRHRRRRAQGGDRRAGRRCSGCRSRTGRRSSRPGSEPERGVLVLPAGSSPRRTTATGRPPAGWREFNKRAAADRWFGKDWTRFRPDLDYAALQRPGRRPRRGQRQRAGDGLPAPDDRRAQGSSGRTYYDALANSPFGNDLLLELAKACVDAEKLGPDDVPDLLDRQLLVERPDRPHLGAGLAGGARRRRSARTR